MSSRSLQAKSSKIIYSEDMARRTPAAMLSPGTFHWFHLAGRVSVADTATLTVLIADSMRSTTQSRHYLFRWSPYYWRDDRTFKLLLPHVSGAAAAAVQQWNRPWHVSWDRCDCYLMLYHQQQQNNRSQFFCVRTNSLTGYKQPAFFQSCWSSRWLAVHGTNSHSQRCVVHDHKSSSSSSSSQQVASSVAPPTLTCW